MHFSNRLPLITALFGLVAGVVSAEVEFQRVWPGYRDAASFTDIGEYFGGSENPRGRTLLRSQPEARDGYYWLVRMRSDTPVADATLRLDFRRPGEDVTETREFPLTVPARSQPVYAGLTGRDWPDDNALPTAWRVQLLDAGGTVLAESTSFLWREARVAMP